jgi:hypothetical protein
MLISPAPQSLATFGSKMLDAARHVSYGLQMSQDAPEYATDTVEYATRAIALAHQGIQLPASGAAVATASHAIGLLTDGCTKLAGDDEGYPRDFDGGTKDLVAGMHLLVDAAEQEHVG